MIDGHVPVVTFLKDASASSLESCISMCVLDISFLSYVMFVGSDGVVSSESQIRHLVQYNSKRQAIRLSVVVFWLPACLKILGAYGVLRLYYMCYRR